MLLALVILQILLLVLLVVLVLRTRRTAETTADPRLLALPEQLTRVDARAEALDGHVRQQLRELREDLDRSAAASRQADDAAAVTLRAEVSGAIASLSSTLKTELAAFRTDNRDSGKHLADALHQQHEAIATRLGASASEARQESASARETLHTRLQAMDERSRADTGRLMDTVQQRLDALNAANTAKLEEMRATVDEKLHATLQTRLTESFGQVTTHLGEVQKGLGEMKELATGVGDLKRVLSNVKSRGIVGEFQLGQQLEQMFSPEQYLKNARIKQDSSESVEYALKFPGGEGPGSHVLLPIDAKFPREDWERLEHAYEHGSAEEIAQAGKAFERAIRAEGKRICEKYIDPPTTLPHGIMFLPTEALYAEVVRRPGLQSEIQQNCRVTIAGPSTFMAILTSFQMGFHTLAIQKKGDQVWRVLSSTKTEFEKFGGLMDKVKKQVDTVQNTLGDLSGKTKTINRTLKDVASLELPSTGGNVLRFEDVAGVAPLLAASGEED